LLPNFLGFLKVGSFAWELFNLDGSIFEKKGEFGIEKHIF